MHCELRNLSGLFEAGVLVLGSSENGLFRATPVQGAAVQRKMMGVKDSIAEASVRESRNISGTLYFIRKAGYRAVSSGQM